MGASVHEHAASEGSPIGINGGVKIPSSDGGGGVRTSGIGLADVVSVVGGGRRGKE